MKCHSLFSEANKKNTSNLSSADFAHRMVNVKTHVLIISQFSKQSTTKKDEICFKKKTWSADILMVKVKMSL